MIMDGLQNEKSFWDKVEQFLNRLLIFELGYTFGCYGFSYLSSNILWYFGSLNCFKLVAVNLPCLAYLRLYNLTQSPMHSICLLSFLTQLWHLLVWEWPEALNEFMNNNFIFQATDDIVDQDYVVQYISNNMSFFFNKDDSKQNLQYDDTAFMHFSIALCVITATIFSVLVYLNILSNRIPRLKKIKKIEVFEPKLKTYLKNKKNYFLTSAFFYKIIVIAVCVLFGIYCFAHISQDSKMIGFDPHEILGVSPDAQINTIKKAYRKLALQFHPDRNQNNPQANAKFIKISKAYECLSSEQAKQKCLKYGNPDGASSFKVGIGLPHFMIDVGNQYFILIPIFIVLLVIVPQAFVKWSNRIKPKDANGNLLVNYNMLHSMITPTLNPITFSVIFGSMKELDAAFPQKKALTAEQETGFKSLLVNTRSVTEEQLSKIPPHILYRIYMTYCYMADRGSTDALVEFIPDICHKITMFTLFFSQKMNDNNCLYGNPAWKTTFYGIYPLKLSMFFYKQMFNPGVRIGDTKSIQFLDLTPEEILMAQNIPLGNLQDNLLWDDAKMNSLVDNFPDARKKSVREQLESLPALRLQCRVLLGNEAVTQMTIDDFATIEIKVIRKRITSGYVVTKNYPSLAQEQTNLIVSYNGNMIFFSPIKFKANSKQQVFKFPHRQSVVKDMKFDVSVMSCNYPNMDIETEITVNVLARIQNRRIEIHKDDQMIEKMPKNFFESLASMDAYQEQDKELSDGSDDEEETKAKSSGNRMGGKKQACCDDHDHEHAGGFHEQAEEQEHHHHGHDHEGCDHEH